MLQSVVTTSLRTETYGFRIAWRTLIQEPAYTLAVMLGLSAGLAACLLLLGFVRYSLEYDAQVPDADNIYVVRHRFNVDPSEPVYDLAPMFLRAAALQLPGVVDATCYIPARQEVLPLAVRIDRKTCGAGADRHPGIPTGTGAAHLVWRYCRGTGAAGPDRPDGGCGTPPVCHGGRRGTRTACGRQAAAGRRRRRHAAIQYHHPV
jgi:hypothetical protein